MITRGWGQVTPADLRAYQQEVSQRPDFDPTWAHVFDARDVVKFDMSADEIRVLSRTSVLTSPRRAMVAGNVATFGLFRMYGTSLELSTEGPEVGVFMTLEEAIAWVMS